MTLEIVQTGDPVLRKVARTMSVDEIRSASTKHLIEQASALATTVSELNSAEQFFQEPPEARFGPRPKTFDPLVEIRNNLSFRSNSFRHALRLGVATVIGGLLAAAEHLIRGYWIPMTVVIVLKPNFGGTLQRSVQRITGTVLGALLAALLMLVSAFAAPGEITGRNWVLSAYAEAVRERYRFFSYGDAMLIV